MTEIRFRSREGATRIKNCWKLIGEFVFYYYSVNTYRVAIRKFWLIYIYNGEKIGVDPCTSKKYGLVIAQSRF